jgi:ATP-binding cassette, subfamily B, bacterial
MEPPEPGSDPSSSNLSLFRRLLRLSWRYRARFAQSVLLQLVVLSLSIAILRLTGLSVDLVKKRLDPTEPDPIWPFHFHPPSDWNALQLLLTIGGSVLLLAALNSAFQYAYQISIGKLMHLEIVATLRAEVYAKLQRLSFKFFDTHSAGAIINRVTQDVQLLRSFVDGVLIQGTIIALSLAAFMTYMLTTHVKLTLFSLAMTPLIYVATSVFARLSQPGYRESRRLNDRLVRTMAEGIEGMQVTKVFGREDQEYARFQERATDLRQQQQVNFRRASRFGPIVDFLSQLNLGVLLVFGGFYVISGEITLGELVVFSGLSQQFANRVSMLSGIVDTLQHSLIAARRVFEILDAPLGVESPPDAVQPGRLRGAVRFEKVSFGYDGVSVLRGVDLDVEPGRCVGILGATGSGKSTLLSLIPRFYDPAEGRVFIDGTDIRRFDLDALRRQVGIVFQETRLFRDTVAANIAFGNPEATREQVERAARTAGADRFIQRLPHGYDTELEEGAVNLSGGQRQRLAIARALLLEPPILVLDDPTTAIDPQTEAEVLAAVDGAVQGRTTFIVSNRLSTLRRASFIVVLHDGRLVEQGTHDELMRRGGLYRQTAEIQGVVETAAPSRPVELGVSA